ncbi:MCE family protein [Mycolicibacterium madagascariense]|nr:MCE family protein [Mycolicibacterium madagascariense]
MRTRHLRIGLSVALVLALVAGAFVAYQGFDKANRTHVVAYFDTTNGLFTGDEVRILGVPVGVIDSIEPQAQRVKVGFWVDDSYKVPADAKAVIVSPQLVTARAIQLTPVYTTGPQMRDGATIPLDRTAVPLEYDDLRAQLEKLTTALQPTQPGGVSTLGAFVDTAADNLRGQGANIRSTVIQLSKALSALGDHSGDTFTTIKNISVVVSALQDSASLLTQLNGNLATVTGLLTSDPNAVGNALSDLNSVVTDATQFIKDNRDSLGTATDKLASISTTVNSNLDDIKQALHVFPNAAANFANVYQPSQGALTGAIALNNFADPLRFICGSIEAASRLNGEISSKLCMQYLAPIVKNRQINFLPIGGNPIVGESARPNELTYSEDRLRPDFVPPLPAAPAEPDPALAVSVGDTPPPDATATDPAAGLPGLMVPTQGGS